MWGIPGCISSGHPPFHHCGKREEEAPPRNVNGLLNHSQGKMVRTAEETGGFSHRSIKCFRLHSHYSRISMFNCWQYQWTGLIFQYTFMELEFESHKYTSVANIHHSLRSWDKCCPHHASGVLYGVTNLDPSCASASLALATPEAPSPNRLLLWRPNPTHHRMVLLVPCCWRLWNGRQLECMTILCCNFIIQSRYPLKHFKSTVATIFTICF